MEGEAAATSVSAIDEENRRRRARAVFPFLRSCEKECERAIEGDTRGEIPRWMKGCLIRIGTGLLQIGPDRFNHVFDGMALMHRFEFRDGKVTYQNRFLRSDSYKNNMRAKRIVVSEFGTRGAPDPCKTIFQRFFSLFDLDNMTDNDLVNVVMYGGEAYACSETNNIWKIDTETLESLEKVNLKKYVPIDGAIAHAHEDPDGTVYNLGSSYGLHCYYNIIRIPPKGSAGENPFSGASVVCKIPVLKPRSPSYFHSFAMTENYFVLVEQPLYMSIPKMAWLHFTAGSYADAMSWDPNSQARFHLVRRSDGRLLEGRTYVAAPFFVFHHINAYEEAGHVIIDLCGYEKGDIVRALYVDALEDMFGEGATQTGDGPFCSKARRYVLPLDVNTEEKGKNLVSLKNTEATAILQSDGKVFCAFEILTGTEPWYPELPRINYERYNGKKYRYFYAVGRNDSPGETHIIKVDTETKKTISWTEKDVIPSEPVYLEERDSLDKSEDSGVLLASLLYTNEESKVSLLVLNARTMQEVARVTFKADASVPGDFHGIFLQKS